MSPSEQVDVIQRARDLRQLEQDLGVAGPLDYRLSPDVVAVYLLSQRPDPRYPEYAATSGILTGAPGVPGYMLFNPAGSSRLLEVMSLEVGTSSGTANSISVGGHSSTAGFTNLNALANRLDLFQDESVVIMHADTYFNLATGGVGGFFCHQMFGGGTGVTGMQMVECRTVRGARIYPGHGILVENQQSGTVDLVANVSWREIPRN